MNLSPKTHSEEEPEQQPAPHSSEDTLIQTTPTSDSVTNDTVQQPVQPVSEEIPAQPASSDSVTDATVQQPVLDPVAAAPLPEETVQQPVLDPAVPAPLSEETVQQPGTFSDLTENEESELDEDDDEDLDPEPGLFLHRDVLLTIAGALVVIALLVVFLVAVNRPKDPPTDWIANYTPPPTAGSSTSSEVLYLHWTNQNGELTGQLQLAGKASGKLQSATGPTTGLYSRDNHIIYVVVTLNGQPNTLTGKINATNDTLTLNVPGATSQDGQFVFHTGTASEYQQDTKNLK